MYQLLQVPHPSLDSSVKRTSHPVAQRLFTGLLSSSPPDANCDVFSANASCLRRAVSAPRPLLLHAAGPCCVQDASCEHLADPSRLFTGGEEHGAHNDGVHHSREYT